MDHLIYTNTVVPGVWRGFIAALGFSKCEANSWWGALARSQQPPPRALRGAVQKTTAAYLVGGRRWRHTFIQALDAATVVPALEALVQENLIHRLDATRIEEALWAYTNAAGTWQHEAT